MGELTLSKGSFVLFTESDPGKAWTTEDIAIIAGELAWYLSSTQEGQRKHPEKHPSEDLGQGMASAYPLSKTVFNADWKSLAL